MRRQARSAAGLRAAGLRAAGLAAAIALGLLPGCGGGGSTTAGGAVEQLLLTSVPAEDGVVFSDRVVRTDGVVPVTGDLGADRANLVGRQFLSFDLSPVPSGALITSAVLRVDTFVVVGQPFTSLGSVVADHLDYGVLDANDFGLRALESGLGPLASDSALGAHSLDLTAAVADDVARGRTRCQLRLRFSPEETDGDLNSDFVSFAEAEAAATGSGQAPVLVVTLRRR